MKKIKLLNSAMMPNEGIYKLRRISKENFCQKLIEAYNNNCLESTIGYIDNIKLIKEWTGIDIQFSRANTTVENGDQLLIMKLKYRLGDPAMKGKTQMSEEDFEFFLAEYKED